MGTRRDTEGRGGTLGGTPGVGQGGTLGDKEENLGGHWVGTKKDIGGTTARQGGALGETLGG